MVTEIQSRFTSGFHAKHRNLAAIFVAAALSTTVIWAASSGAFASETHLEPDCLREVEFSCATCAGTAISLKLNKRSTATGTSAAACEAILDTKADDFCTNQKEPSNCVGPCVAGKCKPGGEALNAKSSPTATGFSCSMAEILCSCRCR